jgi:membrane protease subunit HflK
MMESNMAWNEPGGGRDPWGSGQRSGKGAPDLDEMLKRLKTRFGGGGGGGTGGGSATGLPRGAVSIVLVIIALLWAASGFYVVDERERAVVFQFGAYSRTTDAGLRWHLPFPVERVEKVNVTEIRESADRSVMLTEDENIVEIELRVQYRVSSAVDYLFNVRDPDDTLRQATKSALREIVGQNTLDFALVEGREAVADLTRLNLQRILDNYETGLFVNQVNLTDARAPAQVQDAFLDAIKAREDQIRLQNEAEAYANDRLPRARGEAARELAQSVGYRDRVVARAEGDAARFTALVTEFRRAPDITRERLYLDTMSEVLANSSKVLIDVNESNPLIYLPLDKLIGEGGRAATQSPTSQTGGGGTEARMGSTSPNLRSRERGSR